MTQATNFRAGRKLLDTAFADYLSIQRENVLVVARATTARYNDCRILPDTPMAKHTSRIASTHFSIQ